MLNCKFWIATLPVLSGVLISTELGQSAPRPADYYCYRRNVDGAVVNLTPLCAQRQQAAKNASTPGSTPTAGQPAASEASVDRVRIEGSARRKKIEFSDYSYDGKILVGTVKNRTGKAINNISIVYEVEVRAGEGKWRTVDNGSIRTNNRQVDRGGKTNFSEGTMRSGDRIVITDVEFN